MFAKLIHSDPSSSGRHFDDVAADIDSGYHSESPKDFLLKSIVAKLAKNAATIDYNGQYAAKYAELIDSLEELYRSDDWITDQLRKILDPIREFYTLGESPGAVIGSSLGEELSIATYIEREFQELTVGRTEDLLPAVAQLERNMADPKHSRAIMESFRERIHVLKVDLGIDHLAFIDKGVGEIGAVGMLTSLVEATGLPACVYRETGWSDNSALFASIPSPENKVAIIHDIISVEDVIRNAARSIKMLTGAFATGAVVFYQYGEPFDVIETAEGPNIRLEVIEPLNVGAPQMRHDFRILRDAGSLSQPRGGLRNMMGVKNLQPGTGVRTYTKDTLPPLTEGARRILQRLEAKSERRRAANVANGISDESALGDVPSIVEKAPFSRPIVEKTLPSILTDL